jgi:hypothetical protein
MTILPLNGNATSPARFGPSIEVTWISVSDDNTDLWRQRYHLARWIPRFCPGNSARYCKLKQTDRASGYPFSIKDRRVLRINHCHSRQTRTGRYEAQQLVPGVKRGGDYLPSLSGHIPSGARSMLRLCDAAQTSFLMAFSG